MKRYDVIVNLKQWAEREGVHHVTAYRWFREGKLPVPARRVGRLILVDTDAANVDDELVATAARLLVGLCRRLPGDPLDRAHSAVAAVQ